MSTRSRSTAAVALVAALMAVVPGLRPAVVAASPTTGTFVTGDDDARPVDPQYLASSSLRSAAAPESAVGEFTGLTPARLLDTRTGIGAPSRALGDGATLAVRVAGRGGVPASGASAVVLNVTAVRPTEGTFVTVFPGGGALPNVSNLNPEAGSIVANMVTVGLGSDGTVAAYNDAGSTHLLFDVVGYYASASGVQGSRFVPLEPVRLIDTRGTDRLGPDDSIRFPVGDAMPAISGGFDHTAAVLNVTVVRPTRESFLTVHPGDVPTPNASHLNYVAGQRVANLVTVRLPADGVVEFANEFGAADLIVDLVGLYTAEDVGTFGRFVPISPTRFYDSRLDTEFGALKPDEYLALRIGGLQGIPDDALAAVTNVTAVRPTEVGYLSVFSDDLCQLPDTSSLNFDRGQIVPNSVIVALSIANECSEGEGWIGVYNPVGETHVLVDVFGYFT